MNQEAEREVAEHSRLLAQKYFEEGNYGRSFAHLLVVLKLVPALKNELKSFFSTTLSFWGRVLEEQGRYGDLFSCYHQAIQIFPENELVLNNLGLHLFSSALPVVAQHLSGKSWKKHLDFSVLNVRLVSEGIKPSVLWDFGPEISASALSLLVARLKSASLLARSVHVLTVHDDKFVSNLDCVLGNLHHVESAFKFMDVSDSSEKPKMIGDGRLGSIVDMALSVKEQLAGYDGGSEWVDVRCEEDWCIPSLFGILVGYPAVYWLDPASTANCLSLVPLTLSKVLVESEKSKRLLEVFSFSFPQSLEVGTRVSAWNTALADKLKRSKLKFEFQKCSVTRLSVVL